MPKWENMCEVFQVLIELGLYSLSVHSESYLAIFVRFVQHLAFHKEYAQSIL